MQTSGKVIQDLFACFWRNNINPKYYHCSPDHTQYSTMGLLVNNGGSDVE